MSHLFISYSHQDAEYVNQLAQALEKEGFLPWVDDRIDYGTTWTGEVQRRLDECDAFLLVMTSHSFESRWVNNELSRAMRKNKPIFPLLLEGEEPWLAVESIQFLDVRGGKLPEERFYQQLGTVAERKKPAPEPVPEKVIESTREPIPAKVAEPILEPPTAKEQVDEKIVDELPVKHEAVETKIQPAVVLPGKVEEKKTTISPEVVKKKREKPEKAPKISRPVRPSLRKWVIGMGVMFGLAVLGTGVWMLLRESGQSTSAATMTERAGTATTAGDKTPPPTTTAGTSFTLPSQPITVENAEQVVEVMQWGNGEVITTMAMDWFGIGEKVGVGTSKGVRILDATSLEVISNFEYGESVTALAFTKDGNTMAIGLVSNSILVVTLSGEDIYKLDDATSTINSLAFDENGKWLAAGLEDGRFMIWSMEDGSLVEQKILSYPITQILFFTSDQLLTGTAGNELFLWKWNPLEIVGSFEAPPEGVLSLAFSPDGNTLAAGCADGFIRLWEAGSGGFLQQLYGITHRVRAIAYSGDGTILASGTENGRIYLWKPEESDEPVATLEGYHTLQIRSLAFIPDGTLISAGQDGKVLRWDLDTRSPIAENTDFSQPVNFVTLSPDLTDLAYATLEGAIYIENISGEKPTVVLKGPPDSYGFEFIDDGERVITVSSVGILIESETDSPVKVVDGMPTEVTSAAFHPEREEFAVGFYDATIRFYDFSGNLLDAWNTDQADNAVTLLEYNPDGELLAASYQDGLLVVWQKREPLKRFFLEEVGVMKAMTFTPEKGPLLVAGDDGRLRAMSMESGEMIDLSIAGFEEGMGISEMEFSMDGTILTLGLNDNRIALVDYANLTVLTHLEGHILNISSLTWMPDASMLVSASYDGTIRFWGVEE